MVTHTGAELQVSVPTFTNAGWKQFGGEELARLARKALEEEEEVVVEAV